MCSAQSTSSIAPDQMFDTVPEGAEQFDGRDDRSRLRRLLPARPRDRSERPGRLPGAYRPGQDPRPPAGIRRRALASETLEFIAARGLAIELSTAGWRKPVNELYPSDESHRGCDREEDLLHDRVRRALARAARRKLRAAGEKIAHFGISEICIFERHRSSRAPSNQQRTLCHVERSRDIAYVFSLQRVA